MTTPSLIARVLVLGEEFEQVQSAISDGIDRGADPCKLALSVVNGAQALGRFDVVSRRVDTAVKGPIRRHMNARLRWGRLYLATGRNARGRRCCSRKRPS